MGKGLLKGLPPLVGIWPTLLSGAIVVTGKFGPVELLQGAGWPLGLSVVQKIVDERAASTALRDAQSERDKAEDERQKAETERQKAAAERDKAEAERRLAEQRHQQLMELVTQQASGQGGGRRAPSPGFVPGRGDN